MGCEKVKRWNGWVIFFLVILIGTDIFLHLPFISIESNYCAIILAFVGILATFIVVSNYAQVKDIEDKFEKKSNELDVNFEIITNNFFAQTMLINNVQNAFQLFEGSYKIYADNIVLLTNFLKSQHQETDTSTYLAILKQYKKRVEDSQELIELINLLEKK